MRNDMIIDTDFDPDSEPGPGPVPVKWMLDGSTDLTEAAERLRAFAAELTALAEQGWTLEQPVDGGFLLLLDADGKPADLPGTTTVLAGS